MVLNMEQKENIEKFLNEMYKIYNKSNFSEFLNKIFRYNIEINSYKKNINDIANKIFNNTLNINMNLKYLEFNNYYYIENQNNNYDFENIILDIPVFDNTYEIIANKLIYFLYENRINFKIKLYKYVKNTIFQIIVFTINDANKIINFFGKDNELNNIIKSRTLKFLYQNNLIGIYFDIKPYSFKNIFVQTLYLYYSKLKDNKTINLDSFLNFISNLNKSEKNLNKKRMLNLLYKYYNLINNGEDIFEILKENHSMDLSSYNANDFILKLDENNMIYFINKLDNNIIIKYKDDEFLNVAYSKFYESHIKKEKSEIYYNEFYNIFNKILSNNFNYIDNLLNLIDKKMDRITKLLLILSATYFAHKKFNFNFKQCYEIIDYLLNILDNYIKKEINNNYSIKYILTEEYGNKEITLRNGKLTKIKDYIEKNNIIQNIPSNCKIYLNDGSEISGKEFINNLYRYIDKYNNFSELAASLINTIEY